MPTLNTPDPQQFNYFVRDILSPYLCGDYELNSRGQELVFEANSKLDDEYARVQNLPVANWCFREIMSRLEHLPPREFGTFLDVCAGTGYVSLNLMRKKIFKKCVALDLNPEALAILEERAKQFGIEGIETQIGDIMKTQFPDNSFDCIIGNAFLHHLPDSPTFLKEMYRILKPGGTFYLSLEPSYSVMKWQNYIPIMIKGLFGKRHFPKGEVPLTDIWQFQEKPLTKLFHEAQFKEVKAFGWGSWAVAITVFLGRFWQRFGHPEPSWIGNLRQKLYWVEERLAGERPIDDLCYISIVAKKV